MPCVSRCLSADLICKYISLELHVIRVFLKLQLFFFQNCNLRVFLCHFLSFFKKKRFVKALDHYFLKYLNKLRKISYCKALELYLHSFIHYAAAV